MKKHEIRKAVEKAARKHMPDVIDSVARSAAYDQVHAAMMPAEEEASESPKERAAEGDAPPQPRTYARPVMTSPAALAAMRIGKK